MQQLKGSTVAMNIKVVDAFSKALKKALFSCHEFLATWRLHRLIADHGRGPTLSAVERLFKEELDERAAQFCKDNWQDYVPRH